jgi:membrane associated rhomboid family serine protease
MEVAEKERMPRLSLGEERNMVTQLLLVNITVYILLYFIKIIYQMENLTIADFDRDILRNAVVSAQPMTLLTKPWTLITAMFTHVAFWDVFSNMVWLYCFGSLLQQFSGVRLVIPLYVFGSLCGFAFYVAGVNLIPGLKPLAAAGPGMMGAGAGVMAIAIGLTALAPGNRVFPLVLRGGIPIWIITCIYIALHLTAVFTGNSRTSSLIYLLGGAFLGFMFIASGTFMGFMFDSQKNGKWGAGVSKVIFNFTHLFHPKTNMDSEDVPEPEKHDRKGNPVPYVKVGHVPEHKVNELLDKINEQGFKSLSAEEREILIRASREQDSEI